MDNDTRSTSPVEIFTETICENQSTEASDDSSATLIADHSSSVPEIKPELSIGEMSVDEARTGMDAVLETSVETSKDQSLGNDSCSLPADWLPSSKRDVILNAINAQFQTILGDSTEDVERCRAFWQHLSEQQCRLRVPEIPTRFRKGFTGYTLEAYDRFLCTWLQGQAKTLTEKKMAYIMLKVLNDLIVATHPSLTDTIGGTLGHTDGATTPESNKRNYEAMMTGSRQQAKPRRKLQKTMRAPRTVQGKQTKGSLDFTGNVYDSVQQVSTSLTKWCELLMRQNKGSLAAEVVQVASACATTLAMFSSKELLLEFQQNTRLLAAIGLAIHKLVQFGATLTQEDNVTSLATVSFFARLSGGSYLRVHQKCYVSILASVNLLGVLWPQGFSNFTKLGDMPVLPAPTLCGHLYDYLSKNLALKKLCMTLHRRLQVRLSTQSESILLHCTLHSIDNLLLLFKRDTLDGASEMIDDRGQQKYGDIRSQTSTSGIAIALDDGEHSVDINLTSERTSVLVSEEGHSKDVVDEEVKLIDLGMTTDDSNARYPEAALSDDEDALIVSLTRNTTTNV